MIIILFYTDIYSNSHIPFRCEPKHTLLSSFCLHSVVIPYSHTPFRLFFHDLILHFPYSFHHNPHTPILHSTQGLEGDDDLTIFCATCGQPTGIKKAIHHMERCFSKVTTTASQYIHFIAENMGPFYEEYLCYFGPIIKFSLGINNYVGFFW